jgi:hypothetical protein
VRGELEGARGYEATQMAMKGWRRIGIVLSVIWFLGFGIYQLAQPTFEVELYGRSLHNCTTIYEEAQENVRKFARDADDMIKRWMPDIEAALKECEEQAKLRYEGAEPSVYARLAEIIIVNLITIALAWLVAWGCVAVGRWVYRGFAAS